MRSVFVQFLPSGHGHGCLSSVDLDLEGWDTARDLKGSVCIWPDQAHNRPNDPNVEALISAWTAAGVTWVTTDEALARGYRLGPPFQYFDETMEPDAAYGTLPEGADPLDPTCRLEWSGNRRATALDAVRSALGRLRAVVVRG